MKKTSPVYIEIAKSSLFSADWYLARYPDVAAAGMDPLEHYLRHGAAEGRDPGPDFCTGAYLRRYPDVAQAGVNPLLHYLMHGQSEGRDAGPYPVPGASEGRGYLNFGAYLSHSLLNPMVEAPFAEPDKRCFALMENIAGWLSRKSAARENLPLVSIIMPMRDRAAVVGGAIKSVLEQTYRRFELIVVDDCSLDGSVQVVRSFSDPRIRLIENGRSLGVSAARNRGLDAAQGDLIAYLDSDNSWLPDYLAAMSGAFLLLSDADAAYCGQYLYRGDEDHPFAVRFGCYNPALLRNRNYIDLNCFVHRRAVLKTIGGGFSEEMKRLVDWDLILRISRVGKIYSIPIIRSNYHYDTTDNAITDCEALSPAREALMDRGEYGYRKATPGRDRLTRKVSVIIPSYETLDSLKSCLASLAELSANPLVQVVIVDNASGPEVTSYLRSLAGQGVQVIFNDYNYGFSYAVNQGAALAAPGSDIFLLNNDALLTVGALGALQETAYSSDTIAIAVPQQVLSEGEPMILTHVPYAERNMPCDVTLSAHHGNVEPLPLFHDGSMVDLNFAPFFCAYIKRDVWEICGGLDAQHGRHYRSDRIMCDFVRQVLGRRIVYTPSSVVFHQHQAATKELAARGENSPDYQTIFEQNRWPDDVRNRLGYIQPAWDF